jgi:hypothetical protein
MKWLQAIIRFGTSIRERPAKLYFPLRPVFSPGAHLIGAARDKNDRSHFGQMARPISA